MTKLGRKKFIGFILGLVIALTVGMAQAGTKNNAIGGGAGVTADTSSWGVSYEHSVTDWFALTVGGGGLIDTVNPDVRSAGAVSGGVRFYPMNKKLEGFFIGESLGYTWATVDHWNGYYIQQIGVDSMVSFTELGYKFLIKDGFFIEPSIQLGVAFTSSNYIVSELGGGISIGITF